MVPTCATFTTPIGTIHITESNDIEHLDIIGDERPPEVVAAEMIKNIYLAHFAPEHLPESWRADHMATEARQKRESMIEKQAKCQQAIDKLAELVDWHIFNTAETNEFTDAEIQRFEKYWRKGIASDLAVQIILSDRKSNQEGAQ
jgi:sugar/nucleoside kinase (ribokinase family)